MNKLYNTHNQLSLSSNNALGREDSLYGTKQTI